RGPIHSARMLLGLVLAFDFLAHAHAHAHAQAPPAASVSLTILQTSDLHGRVHPHDSVEDRDLGGSLSRVAAAVRAVRAEGRPAILVDSRDTIHGAPAQP